MICIKQGVDIRGIGSEISLGIRILEGVFEKYGAPVMITACRDGKHMDGSKHYIGDAVDIRLVSKYRTEEFIDMKVLAAGREALGAQFDFLLEDTHFHCEFDPKGDISA